MMRKRMLEFVRETIFFLITYNGIRSVALWRSTIVCTNPNNCF